MGQVALPDITVVYNGKDISREISRDFISLKYKDSVEGKSSSIDLSMENADMRWANTWYPKLGDKISVSIDTLDCGDFFVDNPELQGPPDSILIKGVSNIDLEQRLKTKRTKAHENVTLSQIAQHVATANRLRLIGSVPSILIGRVTQRREHDLKFLRRISLAYGIIFSVRGDMLIYTDLASIEDRNSSLVLDKSDLIRYATQDKLYEVYKDVQVSYHNPTNRSIITANESSSHVVTLQNADQLSYPQITSNNTLVVHHRAENQQQAQAIAKAQLYRANSLKQMIQAATKGTPLIVAGNNLDLTGLGTAASGKWAITEATHVVNKSSGWGIDFEGKRVGVIPQQRAIGAKNQQPTFSTANKASSITTLTNQDGLTYPQINR